MIQEPGASRPSGEPVIVAVLDTGIWSDPDLLPPERLLAGYDFVHDDGDPRDDNGHGTHVASLIAGARDHPFPALCPECVILPIKVLDERGEGTPADVARGIRFATRSGARVLNLSMGYAASSEGAGAVRSAVADALRAGALVVASVGNDGGFGLTEPASLPGVLAVAAVDSAGRRATYSNLSPRIDVAAPGGDDADRNGDGIPDAIVSIGLTSRSPYQREPGPESWIFSGTSQATAHVSALAARLMAAGVDATRARAILLATASDDALPGFDAATGFGIIQFGTALELAWSGEEPPLREGLSASLIPADPIHEGAWTALVRDTSTGLPVAGATVYVNWKGDPSPYRSAISGPLGIAQLPGPSASGPPRIVRVVRGGRPFDPSELLPQDRLAVGNRGLIAAPLRRYLGHPSGTVRVEAAGGS